MNYTLVRQSFNEWGIISLLTAEDNSLSFITLEHSYNNLPKLPNGIYNCQLGIHNLPKEGQVQRYEVMNVPGHSGILIHLGNYNNDSDGCILIGSSLGQQMILGSKEAFNSFMEAQAGQPFNLTVS